ncbi:hypothetical protein PTSG_05074 [Salpingoeca rosetta]|uniref:Uncharacterized protein n=1 Tax=Salpingoeca rosetta (strain ATCC 50818 / BSB-021) TaxID=946362 RepID=F2U9F9_SALR5|nr:uncharacterized protein PTSG_05074 [Salpingoeca rosetta]EGD73362.1 hypothetical protein PTSG_05074 [Salpingoeca rosetta]|eukprot:XP_004994392.1 hypothetical protein PTSG_05074 [Salpingoeca rosetta]
MGGAHMMGWEEQLWIHTPMVMVGTSNHSDAAMRSSSAATVIAIIAITLRPTPAPISLRLTPAPIWRDADIAHVTRSDEEQQLMSGCILDELTLWLWSISTCSSSSLVTNGSGCGRGCGGCNVRRCAVASHDDDDDDGGE